MRLRRSTISKLFAVGLVTLIVLPFTAPFQTVDFSAPLGKLARVLLPADKLAKDTGTPAFTDLIAPFFFSVAALVASLISGQQRHQVVRAALRL